MLWRTSCQVSIQIIIAPKHVPVEPKRYVTKKNYGKVPGYMTKIKDEIDEEYNIVKDMQLQEDEMREKEKYMLPEEEKLQLIDSLKKKWEVLHHEYQAIITKVTKVNPLGLKTLKEGLEKEKIGRAHV